MPLTWTPVVESPGLSCKTPAQFTTASTLRRTGSQSDMSVAAATSICTATASINPIFLPLLVTLTTECPCAAKRPATADPIRPLAPTISTRTAALPPEQTCTPCCCASPHEQPTLEYQTQFRL